MAPPNNNQPGTKRLRNNSMDSDSDTEPIQRVTRIWPKFLLIESTDSNRPLTKLSPFAIAKALLGLAGEIKSVKKLRSGQLLVECDKKSHSDNLLKAKVFADIPIKATPHKSLNSSKGIIRCKDLENSNEAEIAENLRPQGVTAVKRIEITRDGKKIPINTYILTFNTPTLPRSIKAGYMHIQVDPYIPNPLRCFRCQQFNHHKDNCKKNIVCARCGEEGHEDSSCTKQKSCTNCKGDHCSYSKECPKWKQEKEIQRLKFTNGITFQEARRIVETNIQNLPKGISYASATTVIQPKPMKTTATQTDLTWPDNAPRYKSLTASNTKSSSSTQTNSQQSKEPKEQSTKDYTLPTIKSPKKNIKNNSDRQPKGSDDPIKLHNRYGAIEDMETELSELSPQPHCSSKGNNKKFTPVRPPD